MKIHTIWEDPTGGYSTSRVLLTAWSAFFFIVVITTPDRLTPEFYSLYNTVFIGMISWSAGSKMMSSYADTKMPPPDDGVTDTTDVSEHEKG